MDLLRGIRAVIAAVFVVVALLAIPSAAQADDPCAAARDALENGQLIDAELRLLVVDGESCAAQLRADVRARQASARRLARIGDSLATEDPAGARRAYAAAIALDAGSRAVGKLAALQPVPVPEPACTDAKGLLDHGKLAQAKAKYLEQQGKGEACAKAGLAKLATRQKAAAELVAVADKLDDIGDHVAADRARTAAIGLDEQAESHDVFDAAKKQGDEWLDQLTDLGTWLGGALGWIAAILVALLLVAWLARVLKEFSRQAGANDKRFPPGVVSIGSALAVAGLCVAAALWIWFDAAFWVAAIVFGSALFVWLLLGVFFPGLVHFLQRTVFRLLVGMGDFGVADDAKADGPGLAAQMSAAIRDGTAPAGYAVDSAGAASAQDAFDQVAAALSGIAPGRIAGALLTLMRALLPSRVVKVGGHVHAQEGAGCGLTLKIVEGRGQLVRDVTLWQGAYGCSGAEPSEKALRRLAVAGAAWLRFALKDVYDLSFSAGTCSKKSWESEAAYQASLEARGELDVRRALVDVALAHDPDNLPALFDAAVLDLRQGAADRAARRLRRVIAGTTEGEALWCKAMYQRAAIELSAWSSDEPEAQKAQAALRAYQIARRVLLSVLGQVDEGKTSELDELRRLEGPLLVSTASIVLLANRTPGTPSFDRSRITPAWRVSLIARVKGAMVPSADADALSAAEIIARVDAGDVIVGERTHYNLACFASRKAALLTGPDRDAALTESLSELELALVSGDAGLKSWAQLDAGLAEVRAARPGAFATTTGVEAPRELAGMRSIGADLAKDLEEEDILTAKELAGATPADCATIALELSVSPGLVERWVGLAGLRELPLMTDEHLNQLDEAGIRSTAALATADLDELRADLLRANGYTASLPTISQLEIWMLEAAG